MKLFSALLCMAVVTIDGKAFDGKAFRPSVRSTTSVQTFGTESSEASLKSVLTLRGGGIIPTKERYVKMVTAAFGLYALQFLVTPAKIVTDHFDAQPDKMMEFWIRGHAATMIPLLYVLFQTSSTELAHKAALTWVLGIGILYPWNAKINGDLKPKYPMHYFPELLMAVLSVAGFLAN